jgi:Flp pilus assembly protein TadG
MRRTLRQLLQEDLGTVLIYTALAIFALAAMGILAVDVSRLLVTRTQLQNAADAGALAGALMYVNGGEPTVAEVRAQAARITSMNKSFGMEGDEEIELDQITVRVNQEQMRVEVETHSVVSQYFLGLAEALTDNTGDVSAIAAARLGELCSASCMKPWSIPDRWDDQSDVGYPAWQNNGFYDKEEFTDQNDSGYWEQGESWEDLNNDGKYNLEFYDPEVTGYQADKDHGFQLELKANNNTKPAAGQYWPIDLPDDVGGSDYRWNITHCNPAAVQPGDDLWTENGNMVGPTAHGMRELYDMDPDAYWDDGCACIEGSDPEFSVSPRIGLIPIHDPRISIETGKKTLRITKIAAFFIEEIRGNGIVVGRFLKVQMPGQPCQGGETAGGFLWNLSLVL